ncbi:uncharacterized protein LOC110443160 isoform X1 [Mizuhopecten yessoensis]|uniref:uncharacterized protein LOC110443160 isoform X1 n=1 Tax=Mizuhopecten yessoensis TaxID=6573 RepID=UPI000B45A5C5|nr:uncharacterized protein LOC110443160 isoform X1 [Mizuhopecten yessoensis]
MSYTLKQLTSGLFVANSSKQQSGHKMCNGHLVKRSALPTTEGCHAQHPHVNTNTCVRSVLATTPKQNVSRPNMVPPVTQQTNRPVTNLPTPVNHEVLKSELVGYDSSSTATLLSGFQHGFSIGYEGGRANLYSKNHKSVRDNMKAVSEKIQKEMQMNRISGPFTKPPFKPFICSPLGLIPKSVPGKFRLIHDLSYPEGNSINAGISKEKSKVTYDTIDTVISLVKSFGTGCLLAKTDIEDAFRIIPIHPKDYPLLGFTWEDKIYYDCCLPMGASSSCQIFELFSSALQWIMMTKYKAAGMSHILDDFLFVGPPDNPKCKQDLQSFLSLCGRLGVPIKADKTEGPTTIITIYGLEVDSIKMECRLPLEKLVKMRQALQNMQTRKKVLLKELQSLIGLLNFACSVVCPGRAFLRRLIDLTTKTNNPSHFIRLNMEARADMRAWSTFLDGFNGKSVFLNDIWLNSEHLKMYTDASGSLGYAGVFGSQWFSKPWTSSMATFQITIKELFPIVLALELWGEQLQNKKVVFMSDNMAVVEVINKQSCREPTLMKLVRRLVVTALRYNIYFKSAHVPGKQNVIADSLSRFKFQEARRRAPWLNNHPTVVPTNLQML